jgi:hypothetical protein
MPTSIPTPANLNFLIALPFSQNRRTFASGPFPIYHTLVTSETYRRPDKAVEAVFTHVG